MFSDIRLEDIAAAKEIALTFTNYMTIQSLITSVIVIILLVPLYKLFFVPLNRVKNLTDIGYGYLKDESKKRGMKLRDVANELRKRRKVGTIPPIYPNGWFGIIESSELPKESVRSVSALGENFAVFRNAKGELFVLDAYCPHLGADLSAGGRVLGDCLECPFHGWQFDGKSGQCSKIPYADSVPSFAKVKKWEATEQSGWIYIWYHAENVPPQWHLSPIKEVENGDWVYCGRVEHTVSCHVQEVSENGADVAHLRHLHKPAMGAGADLRYTWTPKWKFIEHLFLGEWQEGNAPNEHTATLNLSHSMHMFGKLINFSVFDMKTYVTQYGPGTSHILTEMKFGKGVFVQTSTPIGPLEVRLVHRFYTVPSIPLVYSKTVLWGEAIMVERDVMVWNNKSYAYKPILIKEDKLIGRHRRWFLQFYSENSPRLAFAKDSCDW